MFKSPVQLEEWIALDGAVAAVVGGEGDGDNKQSGDDAAGSGNHDGDPNSDPILNRDGHGEQADSDSEGFILMSTPVPPSIFDDPSWKNLDVAPLFRFPGTTAGTIIGKVYFSLAGPSDISSADVLTHPDFDKCWSASLFYMATTVPLNLKLFHDTNLNYLGFEVSLAQDIVPPGDIVMQVSFLYDPFSLGHSNWALLPISSGSISFSAQNNAYYPPIPPTEWEITPPIVPPGPPLTPPGDDPLIPGDPPPLDLPVIPEWTESPLAEWRIEQYDTDLLERGPIIGMTPWEYLDPEDLGAIPATAYLEGKAALGRLTTALAVLRDQAAQDPDTLEGEDLESIGSILRDGDTMRDTLAGQLQLFQETGKAFQAIDPGLRDGAMEEVLATGATRTIAAGQEAEIMASGIDAVTDLLRDSGPDGHEINAVYADAVALAAVNIETKSLRTDQEGVEFNASRARQGVILGNF